jgi:hypothetical protein
LILFPGEFPCNQAGFEEQAKNGAPLPFPLFEMLTKNIPFTEPLVPGAPLAPAYWEFIPDEATRNRPFAHVAGGSKSSEGATTTVSALAVAAANAPFTCAEIGSGEFGAPTPMDRLFLPLTTKPEPPPVQPGNPGVSTTTTTTVTSAPPLSPPGALSIARAKKPLKLKVGKAKTVKVTVTNTGGSATVPGTLRLKAAKGVVVAPASQRLPALLPSDSWTVTYKVKLTAKAKKSSTLSLIGASGSLGAKGSLVVKSLG